MSTDPWGNANPIPFVKLGLNWRNESPESKSLAGDGTEIRSRSGWRLWADQGG